MTYLGFAPNVRNVEPATGDILVYTRGAVPGHGTWNPVTVSGELNIDRGELNIKKFGAVEGVGGNPETNTVALNTALQEASMAGIRGLTTYIPPGKWNILDNITVYWNSTLTGASRGFNQGPYVFNESQGGTQLNVFGTGNLFLPKYQATLENLTIYYPNQKMNAEPDVYGWTFLIGANDPGVTIRNCTVVNPYQLYRTDSNASMSNVQAWPLKTGLHLGRVPGFFLDNVAFNNIDFHTGSTLRDFVQTQGIIAIIDGVELFSFVNFFAFGYNIGRYFKDVDLDNFHGTYGTEFGGGLDQVNFPCVVESPTGLGALGGGYQVSNTSWIPNVDGIAFTFRDTRTPLSLGERPTVSASQVSLHQNAGYLFAAEFHAGSYSDFSWINSRALNMTVAGIANSSNVSRANMTLVGMPATALRKSGIVGDNFPILL